MKPVTMRAFFSSISFLCVCVFGRISLGFDQTAIVDSNISRSPSILNTNCVLEPRSGAARIPDYPEVMPIEHLEIDFEDRGFGNIMKGYIVLSDAQAIGFNTFDDCDAWDVDWSENVGLATFSYIFRSGGPVRLYGDYKADFVYHYLGRVPFFGSGNMSWVFENVDIHVNVSARLNLITSKIIVQSVSLELDFSSMVLDIEQLRVCGVQVEWSSVNEFLLNFRAFYSENRADIEQGVKRMMIDLLKDCTYWEIFEGDYGCVGAKLWSGLTGNSNGRGRLLIFPVIASVMEYGLIQHMQTITKGKAKASCAVESTTEAAPTTTVTSATDAATEATITIITSTGKPGITTETAAANKHPVNMIWVVGAFLSMFVFIW